MNQIMLTNFVMMILVRNCRGCCMSLRRICSLSVQSLKHLRLKNKNKIQSHARPQKSFAITKPNTIPQTGAERKRGAHALEFVRSAAKRSSDSRASAPLRGRSESGLAYPLRPESAQLSTTYWPAQNIRYQPDSPLSHPAQKTTHQSIIPGASQPD
jgi:hypothetical protein